jgi:hypothetical protein
MIHYRDPSFQGLIPKPLAEYHDPHHQITKNSANLQSLNPDL